MLFANLEIIHFFGAVNMLQKCAVSFIFKMCIFSSLGRSPEKLMSGLVSASASTFTLKFFKSSYFLNHLMDLVHI